MNKEEFEKNGFTSETLPSGYLNIINSEPFLYNNTKTICCYGGRYSRTTTHKDLSSLFSNLFELKTIDRATLNSRPFIKENTKEIRQARQAPNSPVINQEVITPDPPKKRGRPKKSQTIPEQIVSG